MESTACGHSSYLCELCPMKRHVINSLNKEALLNFCEGSHQQVCLNNKPQQQVPNIHCYLMGLRAATQTAVIVQRFYITKEGYCAASDMQCNVYEALLLAQPLQAGHAKSL